MRIESIDIANLQPFASSEVEFPRGSSRGKLGEVHLFTGPNGTGKSRLLSLLAASTTDGSSAPASDRFPAGISLSSKNFGEGQILVFLDSENERKCTVRSSDESMLGFAFSGACLIQRSNLEILKGSAPPTEVERLSFSSWIPDNVSQRIANLKVQVAMEMMNGENGRSLKIAQRLESAISEVTGRKFAISVQAHPTPSIWFRWGNRTLPVHGLPAGLNSLISWMFAAATVMDLTYPDSDDPLMNEAFFFLDEPETYLHPEWQRRILPMAQRLFPNSQFFVATHSPFVVSSINEGFIYKLIQDEHGEVIISEAIAASKGDSYINAVSEILGLSEWFDPESETLLAEFRKERDAALKGNREAESKARGLAESISGRSEELANIIGMELRQLDRHLEKNTAATKP